MISKKDKIIVAVSGGPDSVCLLDNLHRLSRAYKLKLIIAHLNHGLRGKESDLDQEFCERLGKKMGIPVFSEKIKVKKINGSLEDSARNERYKFLKRVAEKMGANKIAMGHTADDQIETVLMRILRGTGVRGLAGIPPVRKFGNLVIIRPLLNMSKEEVMDSLKNNNLSYRTDSSNLKTDFFRNKVRLKLIPELVKYNPNIKETLQNLGRNTAILNDFLKGVVEKEFKRIVKKEDGGFSVSIVDLKKIHQAIVRELIINIISELSPNVSLNSVQIDIIVKLIEDSRGSKRIYVKDVEIIREYNSLLFSRKSGAKRDFEVNLTIPGKIKIPNSNILIINRLCKYNKLKSKNLFEVYLDCDRISPSLIVRNRRKGDVFQPIGLKGRKKVKDIFINLKIPERLRDKIPIFVSDDEICWIAGYRIGERFKIVPETKRVLKIKVTGLGKIWQTQ